MAALMQPDWTMVALALVGLLTLYVPKVRCAVLGGHPGSVRSVWFVEGGRWVGWARCSSCGEINPEIVA